MSIENNPLKQYFRRPAIYVRLPSNLPYPEDVVKVTENGELPVFPMTAIDEITARTPDALFNGTAVVDIIQSCVPNILNAWKLNSVDLDAVLIAVKVASNGNNLEIETNCPNCTESAKYDIDLVRVLSSLGSGNYNEELIMDDLKFKFRPLTFKEMQAVSTRQFQFQQLFNEINDENNPQTTEEKTERSRVALKEITEVTMQTLAKTVEYISTPTVLVEDETFILDFLENCDKKTYIAVRDRNAKLKEETDLKPLDIRCMHCQHEYKQLFTLNMSDFFE